MIKDTSKTAIPFKWDGVEYPSLYALSKAVNINYATLTEWYRKGVITEKLKERLKPNEIKYYSGIDKSLSQMTNQQLIKLYVDYNDMLMMITDELYNRTSDEFDE